MNTGSGKVEREARQPRARQRHLRCQETPNTRTMMSGLGLHLMASLRVENGPSPFALLILLPRPLWVGGGSERGGGGGGQWWAAVSGA